MNCKEKLAAVGAALPKIVFPSENCDLSKFSCVACDQYSARPQYWEQVEDLVGGSPSSLYMMMPEAWLTDASRAAHEAAIPSVMERYLADGSLAEIGEGMVFLHRSTTTGVRRGLVLMLDLEEYDYRPGSKTMIRATEKTVVERLPVRIQIRKGVPLEMPHIMVLIADRENALMGMLDRLTEDMAPLYDFELMQRSGHLKGWFLRGENELSAIADRLLELREKAADGMLYAIGDGNHSLAAAKEHWNALKASLTADELRDHPARYCMVEIVNLFDDALAFEPIHRLLMNVDAEQVQRDLGFDAAQPPSLQELQPKLDEWLASHPESGIEYIHGEQECRELGGKPGNLAIIWDEFPKGDLFADVARNGVLVRKSFSMGAAPDKRFYLECRKIR